MSKTEKFKVSSHLKDIIGRELVTNEYVAIFELVKNSFDANASRVDIEFDPEAGRLIITDDGHGMSQEDIRNKWLFVAYSEKALVGPDTYRAKIKPAGQFAGSKGIGRFACDTLGSRLDMYSRAKGSDSISKLEVNWSRFEDDSSEEFQSIDVAVSTVKSFPPAVNAPCLTESGTVLVIEQTRHYWNADRIEKLRKDLAKLIDPFGTTTNVTVSTWLLDDSDQAIDGVDGPIGNDIAQLLMEKTSRIDVKIDNGFIDTTLIDRGKKIYVVREPSPYDELNDCQIEGRIFYLNRSAKRTFTIRMGVRPVEFGSVFLFLNRFRIFPIGEEFDDTFGLNRRKQQGQSRYVGTRDLIGRVDVFAPPKMFREVSSRDAGLIKDARSRALFEAITKYMIFRLERYVVGVNWRDKSDHDRDTPEGLDTDSSRSRILSVVGALAKAKDVEILYYDKELTRVPEDPDSITDETLKSLSQLADSSGDVKLLQRIEAAKSRIEELRVSREEAQEAARRALEEQKHTNQRIALLEKQAAFLGSSLDVDVERVQLLMHQAKIHLGHVRAAISNAAHEIRSLLAAAVVPVGVDEIHDIEDHFASIRQSARRISVAVAGATLSGDRLGAVLSFAPNIRVDLETDKVEGDLLRFLKEYFEVRLDGITNIPAANFDASGLGLYRSFSPVDIAVLVDNLLDNAHKANAHKIDFKASRKGKSAIVIRVSDDGLGIDKRKVDSSKIFERGYSGYANGTGLGLYSIRHVLQEMGGSIEMAGDGSRADFDIVIPGEIHES